MESFAERIERKATEANEKARAEYICKECVVWKQEIKRLKELIASTSDRMLRQADDLQELINLKDAEIARLKGRVG